MGPEDEMVVAAPKELQNPWVATDGDRPEGALCFLVERAIEDQSHAPADKLRIRPRHALRKPVGPASKARPVASRFGSRCQRELPDMVRARLRTASRLAVDAGGDDRGERFHGVRYSGDRSP